MYIRAWQHVPEARALISRYAIGFSAAAGLWFISAFIPSPARFILWVAAMFIDLFVPFSPKSRLLQRLLPPSPHHLPERFALLTIIVFGESFLKIISGLAGEQIGLVNLIVNFPSLIIAGALWWLYFDNVAESFVRWGSWNVQVWLYTHLPFQASVAALGVGMYKIITLDPAKPLPDNYRWLICIATALALIALGVIELTTKERIGERKGTFDFAIRVAGAILILSLGVVGSSLDEIIIMLFIALICAGQVVLDLYRRLLYADPQMSGSDEIELASSD